MRSLCLQNCCFVKKKRPPNKELRGRAIFAIWLLSNKCHPLFTTKSVSTKTLFNIDTSRPRIHHKSKIIGNVTSTGHQQVVPRCPSLIRANKMIATFCLDLFELCCGWLCSIFNWNWKTRKRKQTRRWIIQDPLLSLSEPEYIKGAGGRVCYVYVNPLSFAADFLRQAWESN